MIISELVKLHLHLGKTPNFFFWRDHKGKEVDLLIDKGNELIPIELKSGKTIHESSFYGLDYWNKISGSTSDQSILIYGGNQNQHRSSGAVIPWSTLYKYDKLSDSLK